LLEVVVALAIAGLAFVVMFRAAGGGLFAVDTAGRTQEALQRAQSHLAAVGRDVARLEGITEGDDGGGYQWRLHVEPVGHWEVPQTVTSSGAMATLYDVEVAISWPGYGHNRAVVLKTRRFAEGKQ
jgi:general secretion pathway protein I